MSLEIIKLIKTYSNGVRAIDNLSLTINHGMFGLLGPNGAGKSSLMRTIATLQSADAGEIRFNGIDVLSDQTALRKVLGYLPQEFGVYPNVSAEKLLDYFATLKGVASKKDRKRLIHEALEITNLFDVRKKHVSGYSGGMKQRFGIAQLLLNDPKLIIVDEPTAGLDPAERVRFLNILREIGTNHTVIFSTHIVEDIKELCTEMAIMNTGKIIMQSKPSLATTGIEGKIWTKVTSKEKLKQEQDNHQVLSSNFNEDNSLSIRVFCSTKPSNDFIGTEPNLEDVYFLALQSN